jgi:hypothetical protein
VLRQSLIGIPQQTWEAVLPKSRRRLLIAVFQRLDPTSYSFIRHESTPLMPRFPAFSGVLSHFANKSRKSWRTSDRGVHFRLSPHFGSISSPPQLKRNLVKPWQGTQPAEGEMLTQ